MALRMGYLYDVLRAIGASEDQAREAAEEVAGYDLRISTIEREIAILKWMMGTMIALQLIALGGLLTVILRLLPPVR